MKWKKNFFFRKFLTTQSSPTSSLLAAWCGLLGVYWIWVWDNCWVYRNYLFYSQMKYYPYSSIKLAGSVIAAGPVISQQYSIVLYFQVCWVSTISLVMSQSLVMPCTIIIIWHVIYQVTMPSRLGLSHSLCMTCFLWIEVHLLWQPGVREPLTQRPVLYLCCALGQGHLVNRLIMPLLGGQLVLVGLILVVSFTVSCTGIGYHSAITDLPSIITCSQ